MAELIGYPEGKPAWVKNLKKLAIKNSAAPGGKKALAQLADDNDLLLLQNCHDSVTSVTSEIRRLAPELVKTGMNEQIKKIGTEALPNLT